MSVLHCHSILQKYKKNLTFQKKRTIIHDRYAAITSFMLCELYKNQHGLIDNVHQLQKGFYVTFPKSNIEAVCQPGHQKVFTQSEASLHKPQAPYSCEAPYTKRSFLTRAAGSLLVRSTLHEAKLPYTSHRLLTRAKHLRTQLCAPHASCRDVRCCSNLVTRVAGRRCRHAGCC